MIAEKVSVEGIPNKFNVVHFYHRYYIMACDAGDFDVMQAVSGMYPFQGLSFKSVVRKLRAPRNRRKVVRFGIAEIVPIQEGLSGYNVLQLGTSYYAIPQTMGAVDPVTITNTQDSRILTADSLSDLHAAVARVGVQDITLVQEDLNGYNLLQLGTNYYAILQAMGDVDATALTDLCIHPFILTADSLSDLQAMVAEEIHTSQDHNSER